MKKLAFLMILASLVISASSIANAQNYDEEKRGEIKLAGKNAKTYKDLQTNSKTFNSLLQQAVNYSIFTSGDISKLEQFTIELGTISLPATNDPKLVEKTNSSDPTYLAGEMATVVLNAELVKLERIRRHLLSLNNHAYAHKLPRKAYLWTKAIARLEYWKYSEKFQEFDRAYGSFMNYCGGMERNKYTGIVGSKLAELSGLDKFTNPKGETSPDFDRNLRTLDLYLFTMRKEELDFYKNSLKQFDDELSETKRVLTDGKVISDQASESISPFDRPIIKSIYQNLELLIANGEEFSENFKKLIEKIENKSSEVGKLRNLPASPSGALLVSRWSDPNGVQNYTDRVRNALEACRSEFNKIAKKIGVSNPQW